MLKDITRTNNDFRKTYLYKASIIDYISIDTDIQRHLVELVETI